MKKFFKLLFLLALPLSLASCNGGGDLGPTTYKIELNAQAISLEPTETFNLTAVAKDKEDKVLENKVFRFNSSNPTVASIENDGKITAFKAGVTTITCISDKQIASCLVNVSGSESPELAGLSFDPKDVKIKIGTSYTANLKTYPEGVSGIAYAWNSSNPEIATVADGIISAVALGSTVIYASYGNISAKLNVTVDEKGGDVFTISLNKTNAALFLHSELDLVATCSEKATVTWSSSNSGIASVDKDGHVVANSKGTAIITAEAMNQKATCEIIVSEGGDPSGDTNLFVYFYIDYNNVFDADPEKPDDYSFCYHHFEWYVSVPFGNDKKPADPTSAPDPAFPKFAGWSSHPIVDNIPEDLWDFEKDFVPDGTYVFTLYGIWVNE